MFHPRCPTISFFNPSIFRPPFLFQRNERTKVKRRYLLFQTLTTVVSTLLTEKVAGVALCSACLHGAQIRKAAEVKSTRCRERKVSDLVRQLSHLF